MAGDESKQITEPSRRALKLEKQELRCSAGSSQAREVMGKTTGISTPRKPVELRYEDLVANKNLSTEIEEVSVWEGRK